ARVFHLPQAPRGRGPYQRTADRSFPTTIPSTCRHRAPAGCFPTLPSSVRTSPVALMSSARCVFDRASLLTVLFPEVVSLPLSSLRITSATTSRANPLAFLPAEPTGALGVVPLPAPTPPSLLPAPAQCACRISSGTSRSRVSRALSTSMSRV